jgi:hypothetical protein
MRYPRVGRAGTEARREEERRWRDAKGRAVVEGGAHKTNPTDNSLIDIRMTWEGTHLSAGWSAMAAETFPAATASA